MFSSMSHPMVKLVNTADCYHHQNPVITFNIVFINHTSSKQHLPCFIIKLMEFPMVIVILTGKRHETHRVALCDPQPQTVENPSPNHVWKVLYVSFNLYLYAAFTPSACSSNLQPQAPGSDHLLGYQSKTI